MTDKYDNVRVTFRPHDKSNSNGYGAGHSDYDDVEYLTINPGPDPILSLAYRDENGLRTTYIPMAVVLRIDTLIISD
jgi:hypothetical protein